MMKRTFAYLAIGFFTASVQAFIETSPWIKLYLKRTACEANLEQIFDMESLSEVTDPWTDKDKEIIEAFRAELCSGNQPFNTDRYEFEN
ncbi:MAG: hypothetical protein AAFP76_00820 [Bacteroidota bacterium]